MQTRIEIPEYCRSCQFFGTQDTYCYLYGKYAKYDFPDNKKPLFCKVAYVEITTHNDLTDIKLKDAEE